MASKALKNPLLHYVTKRGTAKVATFSFKEPTIQTSSLTNGIYVACLDNGSPVTRLTVAFRAGSRYEPRTEMGIAHVLRSSAGLSTGRTSAFITRRKLAQTGATLTASGDREFVYYTVESTQDNVQNAIECLSNVISCQEFRAWELSDNAARLKYDVAVISPQERAVDLLHRAAFRRELGNSLYISPNRIGSISSESLQHYASCNLKPERCVITIVGESVDKAQLLGTSLALNPTADVQDVPSKYYGGELRKEMGGDLAHVALAVPGACAGTDESLCLAVAAKALGHGPVTKWGHDNSVLAKSIGNIGPFAAAGFSVSYSDNGLYGAVLSVPKDEANNAVKAVAKALRNPGCINAASITAGKNQLKLQILNEAENGTVLSESMAAQAFYTGSIKTPTALVAAIDQISEGKVQQVLANAVRQPLSMGAAGNLAFVPYVLEL